MEPHSHPKSTPNSNNNNNNGNQNNRKPKPNPRRRPPNQSSTSQSASSIDHNTASSNSNNNPNHPKKNPRKKSNNTSNVGNKETSDTNTSIKPPNQPKKKRNNNNSSKTKKATAQDDQNNSEKHNEKEQELLQQQQAEKIRLEQEEIQRQKQLKEQQDREEQQQKDKQLLESKITSCCHNLHQYIQQTISRKLTRNELESNTLVKSRDAFQSQKKNLKSDLKKCTAFCKKIKSTQSWSSSSATTTTTTTTNGVSSFSDASMAVSPVISSMLNDIKTLNLSRYTEEIAAAFLESKIKVTDVNGIVTICVALHQRYPDFISILIPKILQLFPSSSSSSKTSSSAEDMKLKRVYIRILTEFMMVGILDQPNDIKQLLKIVADAAGAPTSSSTTTSNSSNTTTATQYNVHDAVLLVSFAKATSHDVTGIVPTSIQTDVQFLVEQLNAYNDYQQQEQQKQCIDEENIETTVTPESLSAPESAVAQDEKVTIPTISSPTIRISSEFIPQIESILQQMNEIQQEHAIPQDTIDKFLKHLNGAFQCLCNAYLSTSKKLAKMEKRCEQDRLLTGSLTEQREKGLLDARKLLESIKKSMETLADVLHQNVPIVSLDETDEEQDGAGAVKEGSGLSLLKAEEGRDGNIGPFDDEETRAFYCDIPDLLTTIPPALLGYSPDDVERVKASNLLKYGSGFDAVASNENDGSAGGTSQDVAVDAQLSSLDDITEDAIMGGDDNALDNETGCDGDENKDTPHYKLMVLLEQELPECNRRDKIDEIAEKFCVNHGSSKSARKRLQKALFLLPRARLDLLPYYSRLAAVFDRVFPDISSGLVTELEQQFHGLAKWKKQQNIENRLRNARFVGELTKFRAAPPIVALRCLKRCVDDFSGHNVDVACCLLESCGRYLYRTKHTTSKLKDLMDTMDRIRQAKNFDERTVALLSSAFHMVSPPQSTARKDIKVLSPLESYLKDLLLVRLEPDDKVVTFVSKQILRYPWNDLSLDCGALVVKYLLKACRKGRFRSITAVAAVTATLKRTKPEVLARIVDAVLEELQYSLQNPMIRDQQRTLSYTILLGELHSQGLIAASLIFDQLYLLVNFGHDIPESLRQVSVKEESTDPSNIPNVSSTLIRGPSGVNRTINEEDEENDGEDDEKIDEDEDGKDKPPSPVAVCPHSKYDPRVQCPFDPPSAVFRIKVACSLIDSCASSLVTISNIPRLEKYLGCFQRYLFTKMNIPSDIEFSLLDTFDLIESKLKALSKQGKKPVVITRYKTWLEAHNAVIATEELEDTIEKRSAARLMAQAGATSIMDTEGDTMNQDEMDDSILSFDEADDDDLSVNSQDDESANDESVSSDDNGDLDSTSDQSDVLMEDDDSDEGGEESDEEDEEEDLDEDSSEEETDEEAAHEAYLRKLEEEAFQEEVRKITMEALEKGKISARTNASAKVSDTMPSASQFIRKKGEPLSSSANEVGEGKNLSIGGEIGVTFKLLKRGHKGRVEAKELVVPSDNNLVKVTSKQDDEAARERDLLKARVLRYEEESAAQAYADAYSDNMYSKASEVRRLTMSDIDRNFGSGEYRRNTHRGGRGSGGRGLFNAGR